jgi:hypothetical protein
MTGIFDWPITEKCDPPFGTPKLDNYIHSFGGYLYRLQDYSRTSVKGNGIKCGAIRNSLGT